MEMICQLWFERVANVSQSTFRGILSDTVDSLKPPCHLALVDCLKEVVPAVLGVQLEGEGAVVVDELCDSRVGKTDDQGRFPGRNEVKLLRRALQPRRMNALVPESTRDWAHKMKECRHTLFAALVLLRCRRRLLSHRLGEQVLSFLVLRLLIEPFLVKTASESPVAPVLLDLGGDRSLKWSSGTARRDRRAACGYSPFSLRLLSDPTLVELEEPDLLLDVVESIKCSARNVFAIAPFRYMVDEIAQVPVGSINNRSKT